MGGAYIGVKWLITGAEGADLAIIMAMIPDVGATMFVSPMDAEGITVERQLDTLDHCFPGGHAVVRFNDLKVGPEDVLGEVGQGFRYAQIRLSPARLTHCMRWLGAARRAHDVAVAYARERMPSESVLVTMKGLAFLSRITRWICT